MIDGLCRTDAERHCLDELRSLGAQAKNPRAMEHHERPGTLPRVFAPGRGPS